MNDMKYNGKHQKAKELKSNERKIQLFAKMQKHNWEVVKFYMHIFLCMFCHLVLVPLVPVVFSSVFLPLHFAHLLLSHIRSFLLVHSLILLSHHCTIFLTTRKYYSLLHIFTWYLNAVILVYAYTCSPAIGMAADTYLSTFNTCFVRCMSDVLSLSHIFSLSTLSSFALLIAHSVL